MTTVIEEGTKRRFPLEAARALGETLLGWLAGYCERAKIAGSVRRQKQDVGDLELLVIPAMGMKNSGDLFSTAIPYSKTARRLEVLVNTGLMEYRITKVGTIVNGDKIKLFRDIESEIPVDVFMTTEESWWNYLVCRTGPADSNMNIAKRARQMGLKWEPYSSGFRVLGSKERIICHSEREVFEAVELPYKAWDKEAK